MGFLSNAFQKLQNKAIEEINKSTSPRGKIKKSADENNRSEVPSDISVVTSGSVLSSMTMAEVMHYGSEATRWEKAVVASDSVVNAVGRFDPDGVDIVCVGGTKKVLDEAFDMDFDSIETFSNIVDITVIEERITSRDPGGPCPLGKAMETVLQKALHNDDPEKKHQPCSVLVMTAGKPDDPELLEETLRNASQTVADRGGVEACPLSISFIQIGKDKEAEKYLRYLDKKMVGYSDEDKKVDIVDTMGYQELKETVKAIEDDQDQTKDKSQRGAVAGAALGFVAGAAIGVGGMVLASKQKAKKDSKDGSSKLGTVGILGAAIAGAASGGFAGYAIHKKFFDRVGKEEPCDYVLVLDRSAKMEIVDEN